ncbi:SGNH/GDSL hydrolase family protein [Nocardioides yefusunii]|uniref:SGNH/GDSL hydrolase family protein n=1 Tax=Nocardioides yefusunii TaxID=2500546 RepID=A0ABW1QVX7_9ACTN|nr:SGNH/GDSL hydrolase family protein [Nocardioides yefusunii]
MSRADAARRLASAAGRGGRAATVAGAALYGVLAAEAVAARKKIGRATKPVMDSTGWYGRGRPGPALQVALLGDSSACGYGVDRIEHTPGAYLASGLAVEADRRVHMRQLCVVGDRSSDLWAQVDRTLAMPTDLAVILVGSNDVTHLVKASRAAAQLGEAVRRLREADIEVIVGTCPDLGTIRPLLPPLRQVARHLSRKLAAAQMMATLDEGGHTVSLGDVIGPEFYTNPAELFGDDEFHPSPEGYKACADVLLPTSLAALGLLDDDAPLAGHDRVKALTDAALEAADHPGTALDPVRPGTGRSGRYVEIRQRAPKQTPDHAESPEATDSPDA